MTRLTTGLAAVVLASSLAGGVAIVYLAPPFQAPDEDVHVFRVWQIADDGVFAHAAWTPVPRSLVAAAADWKRALAFRPAARVSREELASLGRTPLAAESTETVWLASPAVYPAVLYLPQALGLRLGLEGGAGPLGLLRAIRLANAVASGILVALAVAAAPATHRPLLALLAMTPMALFLRGTASPDASIFAAALLAAAVLARRAGDGEPGGDGMLVAASAVLAFSKLPYAPLPLLDVAVADRGARARRRWRRLANATLALVGTATLLALARANLPPLRPGADPDRQLADLVAHPFEAGGLLLRTIVFESPRWASQLAGNFGWLDASPPHWLQGLWLAVLTAAFLATPASRLDARRRWAIGLALAGLGVSIVLSQHLTWTLVGARQIEGVQGRYFLPLLAFAALLSPGIAADRTTTLERLAVLASALAPVVVIWTLLDRYWL